MDRPADLHLAGASLALPAFFPSVSSVKTNRLPVDYIELLVASGIPQFLVSAYDVSRSSEPEQIKSAIDAALRNGRVIILDSGNYERFWKQDSTWTREQFHDVLSSYGWPAAFSFDVDGDAAIGESLRARQIVNSGLNDRLCGSHALFPIVHGDTNELPDLCATVAKLSNPIVIAVAERELGEGILARVATVRHIRQSLNRLGSYYFIHLLGTGNPLSILLYAVAGADMFDGLEWCQTVADPESKRLLHFQQRELLQTQLGSPGHTNYEVATLMHNLFFYADWMNQLQRASASNSLLKRVRETVGGAVADRLEGILNDDRCD